jgi:putative transcriptional regulator
MHKSLRRVRPESLRAARAASGLTQAVAAALVYNVVDNWQNWEQGRYPMPPGLYELFLLKTGQLELASSSEWVRRAS